MKKSHLICALVLFSAFGGTLHIVALNHLSVFPSTNHIAATFCHGYYQGVYSRYGGVSVNTRLSGIPSIDRLIVPQYERVLSDIYRAHSQVG